jgi:hypothetical protein
MQEHSPIAKPAERKYTTTERELLGLNSPMRTGGLATNHFFYHRSNSGTSTYHAKTILRITGPEGRTKQGLTKAPRSGRERGWGENYGFVRRDTASGGPIFYWSLGQRRVHIRRVWLGGRNGPSHWSRRGTMPYPLPACGVNSRRQM